MLTLPPGYDLEIRSPVGETVPVSACKQLGEWGGKRDTAVALHSSRPTVGAVLCFPGQPLPRAVHGARAGTGFLLSSQGAGGSVPCRALRLAAGRRMGRLSSQSAAFTPRTGEGRLVCVAGSSAFEAAQWESNSSKMVIGFNLPTRCKNKVTRAHDWRAKRRELHRSGNHLERFEMRNLNLLVQAW